MAMIRGGGGGEGLVARRRFRSAAAWFVRCGGGLTSARLFCRLEKYSGKKLESWWCAR